MLPLKIMISPGQGVFILSLLSQTDMAREIWKDMSFKNRRLTDDCRDM